VFEVIDRPAPRAAAGQLVVRVAYAGVNFAEVQHRRGEFGPPDRPGGYDVPGLEVAGTVAEVGPDVPDLAVGDRVAGYLPGFGGYAELAVAEARFVRPVGALALDVAAGVPTVHATAYGVLTDAGRLRPGESVLIHAAAGGVGSAAAGVARALGAARVYGTVGSADKVVAGGGLGYDAVFVREGFVDAVRDATGGRGVDLVLDPIGGAARRTSLPVLAPFGRLVAYGDLARSGDRSADVWDLWKSSRTVAGYNIGDAVRRAPDTIGRHLEHALATLGSGDLPYRRPTVAPLSAAAEVHQLLESGTSHGKTVLDVRATARDTSSRRCQDAVAGATA
jgi:NADPH2:quinone reductase